MASDQDSKNDPRFLETAKAILAGQPYEERDLGVSKMLNFVLARKGADVWITRSIIKLRFQGSPRIHRYFLNNAPGVVWDLLGRLGLDRVTEPTVGVLRVSGSRLRPWPGGHDADMVGWVIPGNDEIVVHSRPAEGDLPATGPIPEDGPWARPAPPPPWKPPRPQQVNLPTALACPHCATPSSTYRKLTDGFFVCPSCNRSFDPGAHPA